MHSIRQWRFFCILVLVPTGWVKASPPTADSLQRRANAIYRKHPVEALKLLDLAQQLAIQHRQINLAANIRVDEATVHYTQGVYLRATTICQIGLRLTPISDSTRFKLWASLGEMYHQRHRPDSLAYCWQRADDLLTARPALEREARTYVAAFWGNQGTAYLEQGDYRLAERCFQKRLLLLDRHTTPVSQAIAENQFAYFSLKTGNPVRADSLFRASLRHYPTPDLTHGWLLLGLVDCRLQRQQFDSVPVLVRLARQIVQQADSGGAELAGYLDQSLGKYWEQKNRISTARSFFAHSLVIGKQLGRASRVAWRGYMAMSRLAQQKGNMAEALAWVQQAVQLASVRFHSTDLNQNPDAADFLNGPDLFESLCWKAHLLRSSIRLDNHLEQANQTYERAFVLSDLLQASFSSDLTKLFVQEKLRPAYQESIAVAYACYRQHPNNVTLATLLYRQEQGNASVLNETLRTLQDPYPNAPSPLLDQLQQAKSRLSVAKTNWVDRAKAGKRQAVDAELINAELAWNQAYQKLLPYRSNRPTQPNEVAHLKRRLDKQTAFLQYSLTPDSLLLTLVKANSIRVLLLPTSGTELNKLVESLQREAYRNPDPFTYAGQSSARALFNRLLGPIWPDLKPIQRLIIVRDGPLHYLPMEILETGLRPDDYLLRYSAITYAYSMHSFFGDPAIPLTGNPSVLSMAPFAVTETTLATVEQYGYKPLAESEDEVGTWTGTHSTAGNARKSTFLSLVSDHQLLHLATHAEANDTNSGESYIAFFPDGASHRLYAHELGLLDLRHIRLAVLTACRTGSGGLHWGEGLLSLSRSFALAGCPQMVTSLWNAHDGTTATLTRLFYNELRRGKPTDVALQQAKLQFLATQPAGGAFSPPHFWAHLVLMGHNQPVYLPPSDWTLGLMAIGVTGLLLLIGYRKYAS